MTTIRSSSSALIATHVLVLVLMSLSEVAIIAIVILIELDGHIGRCHCCRCIVVVDDELTACSQRVVLLVVVVVVCNTHKNECLSDLLFVASKKEGRHSSV